MADERIDEVRDTNEDRRTPTKSEGGQSIPEMCFKEVHNGGSGKTRLLFFDCVGVID
jgi:hypothetical protein